jgi:hypothetical protein
MVSVRHVQQQGIGRTSMCSSAGNGGSRELSVRCNTWREVMLKVTDSCGPSALLLRKVPLLLLPVRASSQGPEYMRCLALMRSTTARVALFHLRAARQIRQHQTPTTSARAGSQICSAQQQDLSKGIILASPLWSGLNKTLEAQSARQRDRV